MNRRIVSAVIVVVALALLAVGYQQGFFEKLTRRFAEFAQIGNSGSLLEELQKEIFTPPPLHGAINGFVDSHLTRGGVVYWTNEHRKQNGLLPLAANAKLNLAAEQKVKDMFARQYFEHVSPTGIGAGELIEAVGYKFIVVGENLVLGNYKDDAALTQAWMDSPGHRENMLNARFTEIGVAAGSGTFEGKTTWLAVQEFGKPLSDCPAVNESLKIAIENGQRQVDAMESQLQQQRAETTTLKKPRTQEEYEAYKEKVDAYNAAVRTYNFRLDTLRRQIAEYNREVQAFNACIQEG